ncbi:hypothetical protein FRB91_002156 [Serendipita sp. 411]|nr:hypothetical protein FRC16_001250 [Serendipita sp. 398]KAG8819168.1 hypothetical protein FRC19_010045 [Serendipita sp. 401]KAG8854138.1 hypothetical protein FRC20_001095 [Serendipita sp. 405]KAG8860648.1 hypothetical protein FRB91_002156 [Serendipita sp. 411]KAG9052103.1 hypothetical protein FS842_010492 [Serendipita sp. 407]
MIFGPREVGVAITVLFRILPGTLSAKLTNPVLMDDRYGIITSESGTALYLFSRWNRVCASSTADTLFIEDFSHSPSDGVANSYSRQTSPSPLDLHSYSGGISSITIDRVPGIYKVISGTGKLSGGDGVIPVTAETWQNAGVKLEIRSTRGAHSACRPEEISSPPS